MMNPQHRTSAWLERLLVEALAMFNASDDVSLLEDGEDCGSVGECAVTHRLAVHLERTLCVYGYPNEGARLTVDCEYNRHLGRLKEQKVTNDLKNRVQKIKGRRLKESPEKDGSYFFSVFPDIIVHRRGDDDLNLLAIEVKRASNSFDYELDNIKLHLFTAPNDGSGYGYVLGASVIALDTDDFGLRRLEIGRTFIDGQCRYRAAFIADRPARSPFLEPPESGGDPR